MDSERIPCGLCRRVKRANMRIKIPCIRFPVVLPQGRSMNTLIFNILRFNPEKDKKAQFAEYQVPIREGSTVLDGLFYIHKQIDPSLSFRFSCRGSVCGSCAMNINDSYRLACETQIKNLGSTITIRPLSHLPVIKDLVVNMERFWQGYESIKPYLILNSRSDKSTVLHSSTSCNEENPPIPLLSKGDGGGFMDKENIISPAERKKLDGLIECILCGLCFSSCPVTALNEKYLGPHALLKHARFTEDRRDEYKERLKIGVRKEGVWSCKNVFNCQEVCPKNLSPAKAIIRIKHQVIKKKF